VIPGDVGIAREGMKNEYRVRPLAVQFPVGLIDQVDRAKFLARFQLKIVRWGRERESLWPDDAD